jgi:hypothetical protein
MYAVPDVSILALAESLDPDKLERLVLHAPLSAQPSGKN